MKKRRRMKQLLASLLTMALLVTGSISVLAAPEANGGGNQTNQEMDIPEEPELEDEVVNELAPMTMTATAPEANGGGNQETQYGWYPAVADDLKGTDVEFIMVSQNSKKVISKANAQGGAHAEVFSSTTKTDVEGKDYIEPDASFGVFKANSKKSNGTIQSGKTLQPDRSNQHICKYTDTNLKNAQYNVLPAGIKYKTYVLTMNTDGVVSSKNNFGTEKMVPYVKKEIPSGGVVNPEPEPSPEPSPDPGPNPGPEPDGNFDPKPVQPVTGQAVFVYPDGTTATTTGNVPKVLESQKTLEINGVTYTFAGWTENLINSNDENDHNRFERPNDLKVQGDSVPKGTVWYAVYTNTTNTSPDAPKLWEAADGTSLDEHKYGNKKIFFAGSVIKGRTDPAQFPSNKNETTLDVINNHYYYAMTIDPISVSSQKRLKDVQINMHSYTTRSYSGQGKSYIPIVEKPKNVACFMTPSSPDDDFINKELNTNLYLLNSGRGNLELKDASRASQSNWNGEGDVSLNIEINLTGGSSPHLKFNGPDKGFSGDNNYKNMLVFVEGNEAAPSYYTPGAYIKDTGFSVEFIVPGNPAEDSKTEYVGSDAQQPDYTGNNNENPDMIGCIFDGWVDKDDPSLTYKNDTQIPTTTTNKTYIAKFKLGNIEHNYKPLDYVIDFGLPMTGKLDKDCLEFRQIDNEGYVISDNPTVTIAEDDDPFMADKQEKYGKHSINGDTFTYVPTETLKGADSFTLKVTADVTKTIDAANGVTFCAPNMTNSIRRIIGVGEDKRVRTPIYPAKYSRYALDESYHFIGWTDTVPSDDVLTNKPQTIYEPGSYIQGASLKEGAKYYAVYEKYSGTEKEPVAEGETVYRAVTEKERLDALVGKELIVVGLDNKHVLSTNPVADGRGIQGVEAKDKSIARYTVGNDDQVDLATITLTKEQESQVAKFHTESGRTDLLVQDGAGNQMFWDGNNIVMGNASEKPADTVVGFYGNKTRGHNTYMKVVIDGHQLGYDGNKFIQDSGAYLSLYVKDDSRRELPKIDVQGYKVLGDFNFKPEDSEGVKSVGYISINVYPATNIYYENDFAQKVVDASTDVTDKAIPNKELKSPQSADLLGSKRVYGYDEVYDNKVNDIVHNGQFTFAGTGCDVYTESKADSPLANVYVYEENTDNLKKLVFVDTKHVWKQKDENGDVVIAPDGTQTDINPAFGIDATCTPIYDLRGVNSSKNTIVKVIGANVYGYRVYETPLKDNTVENRNLIYGKDDEGNYQYHEVRDLTLATLTLDESKKQDYWMVDGKAYELSEQVKNTTENNAGAIVFDSGNTSGNEFNFDTDMFNCGPKNELYLFPGQTLALKLNETNADYKVSLGMRSMDGTQATCTVNDTEISLNNALDLYHDITPTNGTLITIKNTGKNVVSLTQIKASAKNAETIPASLFSCLNEDDISAVVSRMSYEEVRDTEVPDIDKPDEEVPDIDKPDTEVPDIDKPDTEETETEISDQEEKVFEPESIKMEVKCFGFFGRKTATLTVTTSKDVEYITVNGEKVTSDKNRFFGLNSKNNKFKFKEKVNGNDEIIYEIIAYDKNGVASRTYIAK